MNKTLILMFVKEPKLGFVKTRLAKDCGDEFALGLYECFVKDLIHTLEENKSDFKLCTYGNSDIINKRFGDHDNFLQVEGDLGLKMQSAFEQQFALGYEKIVLIGSDTPHLTNEVINTSFEHLNDNDIVLGPSLDGGYYLIAFNKCSFCDEVFKDISWSTSQVLAQTLQKSEEKKVHLLNKLNDIDVLDDLTEFYASYGEGYFKNSKTMMLLKKNVSWEMPIKK